MKAKWVKTADFKFGDDDDFECFIFMDSRVVKAKFSNGGFTFKYGICGRLHPSHVMKIKTPKPPVQQTDVDIVILLVYETPYYSGYLKFIKSANPHINNAVVAGVVVVCSAFIYRSF